MALEEGDLGDECGKGSLVLQSLYFLLVLFDAGLVVLQRLLDFAHVDAVGVHELRLLSLQHVGDLGLQVESESVEPRNRLLDLTHVLLVLLGPQFRHSYPYLLPLHQTILLSIYRLIPKALETS